MSPPASTNSLPMEIDGSRLFNSKLTIRFSLAATSGPCCTRRVHPDAACLAQRIPSRNQPHLVPPKAEHSTAARALRPEDPLSLLGVQWPDWPDRIEPRHGQVSEQLL